MAHKTNPRHPIKDTLLIAAIIILATALVFLLMMDMRARQALGSCMQESTSCKQYSENFKMYSSGIIDSLKRNLSATEKRNAILLSELSQSDKAKAELQVSYSDLEGDVEKLTEGIEDTLEKIDTFEKELEESIDWFKENSDLDEEGIISDLMSRCVDETEGECRVNTGCIYKYNEDILKVRYKYDMRTSSEEDRLQALPQFLDHKGGDCEDFSLFFKAEVNDIKGMCTGKKIIFEAWSRKNRTVHRYWIDEEENWFIDRAQKVDLGEGYAHPNIICGNFLSNYSGERVGHCIIALSKNRIGSIGELENIKSAELIEPQNGEYYGRMDTPDSGIYLTSRQTLKELPETIIYQVITDDDVYLYSFSHKEWFSYAAFLEKLEADEEELKDILERVR